MSMLRQRHSREELNRQYDDALLALRTRANQWFESWKDLQLQLYALKHYGELSAPHMPFFPHDDNDDRYALFQREKSRFGRLCVAVPSSTRRGIQTLLIMVHQTLAQCSSGSWNNFADFIVVNGNLDAKANQDALFLQRQGLHVDNVLDPELVRKWQDLAPARKIKVDFARAFRLCARTAAPYIMIIEDDALAHDGWLEHVHEGIDMAREGKEEDDWLYLKFFLVPRYDYWHIVVKPPLIVPVAAGFFSAMIYLLSTTLLMYQRPLRLHMILVFIWFTVFTFFMMLFMGGYNVMSLFHTVQETPVLGSAVANVYPARFAEGLATRLEQSAHADDWGVDIVMGEFADENKLRKLVKRPFPFSHLGRLSTRW